MTLLCQVGGCCPRNGERFCKIQPSDAGQRVHDQRDVSLEQTNDSTQASVTNREQVGRFAEGHTHCGRRE